MQYFTIHGQGVYEEENMNGSVVSNSPILKFK